MTSSCRATSPVMTISSRRAPKPRRIMSGSDFTGWHEQVAVVAHRGDELEAGRGGVDLLPEPRDGHVDGAVVGIGVRPRVQSSSWSRVSTRRGRCTKQVEQLELGGGEHDRLAGLGGQPARVEIDDEAVEGVAAVGLWLGRAARAPQQGADAGQQLARIEGLGQVIVGAHLETDHAVDRDRLGREHQDRHAGRRACAAGGRCAGRPRRAASGRG